MNSKKLREQRAKLVADARVITDAVADGETMTTENSAKFDTIMAEADRLKVEIDRADRLTDAESDLSNRIDRRAGRDNLSADEAKAKLDLEASAFKHYLRAGMNGMPDDLRAVATPRFQAAQGTGSDAAGGYTVPEGFYGQVISAELAFGGMLDPGVCDTFSTSTGNPLPIPTDNDTANEGAILGENIQSTEQDVTFGAVTLNGHTYTSKIIRVANQLLQDSAFDLNAFLAGKLGTRVARIMHRHFTTGDGASKPTGVVNASTAAFTSAAATVISPDEIIDLAHSVDPSYRNGARYMMNDNTLKALKKVKDGDGRYIWSSGLAFKEPDSINGYPYTINQHMADIATGTKSMLFGNFSKYMIRNVAGIMVMRLVERYADYNQTGFVMFQRADGNLVDAGTHPVKHILQA
jgi:HK97 family phage major capsid protein